MSNAAATQAGQTPGQSTERVRVPLLAQLLDPAVLDRRRVWVDLGQAQAGLIDRLVGTPSRLIVTDLPRSLAADQTPWHRPETVLHEAVWNESVDGFLCWDLLNYMQAEELAELSRGIALRGGQACTVHALIHYSARMMTAMPADFRLDRDLQLAVSTSGDSTRPAPRYSPKALEKAMPELRVERTMLLNNGMQEFLFRRR